MPFFSALLFLPVHPLRSSLRRSIQATVCSHHIRYLSPFSSSHRTRSIQSACNSLLNNFCLASLETFRSSSPVGAFARAPPSISHPAFWPRRLSSTCYESQMAAPHGAIELDECETNVRNLLLAVCKHIHETDRPVDSSPIVLRFTGGWVRDKLLGGASHDIDVAINNMTGYQFGLKLQEYLDLPGKCEAHGLAPMGKLHKIEANPEKSKHLETTTTRIFGLDIDLVNLRKETYTDDSRNPQMEFGTAEEDALRRDATVNALFYNLDTHQVEDLTGRGLDDMKAKLIRTPLAPLQTFRDDPLRVLRLIRFASRLSFTIEDECFQCMGDADIKEALHRKISRERIGTEVTKMLQGKDPHIALQLIDEAGLYDTIFAPLTIETAAKPELAHWAKTYDFCRDLIEQTHGSDSPLSRLSSALTSNENDSFLLWVWASIIPWANAPLPPPAKSGKPSPPVAYFALGEGIKSPNKVLDVILAASQNLDEVRNIKEACYTATRSSMVDQATTSRETIGMAIRRWGPSWRNQLAFALLYEISQGHRSDDTIMNSYLALLDKIREYQLEDVCDLKRIIDGRALAQALGIKPGPWMKDALDVVVAWQLRNPTSTDPVAVMEAVRSWKTDFDGGKTTGTSRKTESAPDQKTSELISDLISHFLVGHVRSIFAKQPTHGISSQGYKKHDPAVPAGRKRELNSFAGLDGVEEQYWKKSGGLNGTEFGLLRWVVYNLDPDRTEKNWATLLPPVLTILEDYEVTYKTVGCEYLAQLLNRMRPQFLVKTGLAPLFYKQLSNCLTYLPDLTPARQSRDLIAQAFPALFALARCLADSERQSTVALPMSSSSSSSPTLSSQSILLDALSTGLVSTFAHINTAHAGIITECLDQASVAVADLGFDALPLFNTLITKVVVPIMTDPFIVADPVLVMAVVKFSRQLILSGWPRMGAYRNVLTMGMLTVWTRLVDRTESLIEQGPGQSGSVGTKGNAGAESRIEEVVESSPPKKHKADEQQGQGFDIGQLRPDDVSEYQSLEEVKTELAQTMRIFVHVVDHADASPTLDDLNHTDNGNGDADGNVRVEIEVVDLDDEPPSPAVHAGDASPPSPLPPRVEESGNDAKAKQSLASQLTALAESNPQVKALVDAIAVLNR